MNSASSQKLQTLVMSISIVLISAICSGCEGDTLNMGIREGVYAGVFTIRQSDGTEQSGLVTFTFGASTYSCLPDKPYLPPSGAGTFHSYNNTIVLKDNVGHTAEFDWTLILNGEFSFSFDGKTLTLTQNDQKYKRYRIIVLTFQHS